MKKDLNKYYLAFNSSIDGIVFVDCNSGMVDDCNPAFEKLVGRSLGELKKIKMWRLEFATKGKLKKSTFKEIVFTSVTEPVELSIKKSDGTIVQVGLRAKHISQNNRSYLLCIVRDISKKTLAKETLPEAEKIYRTIFEITSTAMAIGDENTILKLVNPSFSKITGFEVKELEGKISWCQFYEPKMRDILCGFLAELKTNPEKCAPLRRREVEWIDRYKNRRIMLLDRVIIPGTKMTAASLTDITDLRSSEEETRKARNIAETYRISEKIKTDLLSVVSHELRTPLTSIKGLTDSLLRKDVNWDENTKRDFLGNISSETKKLSRLIDDLLDATKLGKNLLNLKRARSTMIEVIEAIKVEIGCLSEKHQITYDIQDGQKPLFIDTVRVGQVILNLVENAVKYSLPSSKIIISSKSLRDYLAISVSDEGRGISKKI